VRLVHRGEQGNFLWNDQATPFDFDVNGVAADMSYSFLRSRYDGTLVLGRVSTRYRDYQPFSWTAAARFSLSKNEVEVSSLKLDTGRSHLEASGRIRDFFNPVISADYTGAVNLAEFAFITRQRELRAGFADVNGKGTWTADKFASEGKLALKNFEWRDDQISLRDASLNSDFWLNDRQLKLSKAQGRLLGGAVTGDVEITNWQASQSSPAKGKNAKEKKAEEQKGLLRLRMKDVSASALAAAVSTRKYPLDRLNLAGNADGTIDAPGCDCDGGCVSSVSSACPNMPLASAAFCGVVTRRVAIMPAPGLPPSVFT
jgi:hypothetical protein